jgi:hypothetical protein
MGRPSSDGTSGSGTIAVRLAQLRALVREVELASEPAGSVLMPRVPTP